ncbi:MAG: LysR family transcriptional regulator [Faecalibacterium sp.]
MTEQQLLCFLTVSRTLNFSRAAQELYCTQPALSYQIRSLEKELEVELFRRSTTRVELTEAGAALQPYAEQIFRQILTARADLKAFAHRRQLILRLPPVLLRRDPVYPALIARLHAALPGYEFKVDTRPVQGSIHHLLCTQADAVLCLPLRPLQAEVEAMPVVHNGCYFVAAPDHPLHGRGMLRPADLAGQHILYEPLYQELAAYIRIQPGMPYSIPEWRMQDDYESAYTDLLAGGIMFFCPMKYPSFPDEWYLTLPLPQPIPDTCLLTLRGDPRPEMRTLTEVFREVYHSFGLC